LQPDNSVWYLARAAGITAYLLLWLSLTLGVGITARLFEPEIRRVNIFDLHEFISLFGVLFVGLHVFVLLLDKYVGFTLGELLVPFHSHYQPLWLGLGQVAFYLLLITTFSFYVRGLIGWKAWRCLHLATFLLWVSALAHGFFTGTDTPKLWMLMIYCTTTFVTLMLLVTRLDGARRGRAAVPSDEPRAA
jgi:predicted ferric reductase